MSDLYGLTDIVISFMKQIRFYGISLFDVTLWAMYITITLIAVFALLGLRGSDD